jgi:acyl-CoA synthetase (AMP-forming)/AMP-acid ligase II
MDPTRPAKVDPRRIIQPVEDFGVTMMFGSPALLDTVGRYGERHGATLPTVKRVLSAGAPVSPSVVARFKKMLPPDACILTPYGASEALPVAVISSREILEETGEKTDRGEGVCVGQPVPSIDLELIAVTDDAVPTWSDAEPVPQGSIGEIVVKGPQVTAEYYNADRHNRLGKIAEPDGTVRHRMGDLGYLDEAGRLWFVGRKSQRVVTPDGTMHTEPCEAVFNTHPLVFRTALVGVGEDGQQQPVICVELEKSAAGTDREQLYRELASLGAKFEHTRSIETFLVHPRFPVDIRHNAKIGRGELARWAARKLGRRGGA